MDMEPTARVRPLVLSFHKSIPTAAEIHAIEVKYGFNKPIYILHPIQDDVSYKEEILAMLPTILNGNLSLIKNKVKTKKS